MPEWIKEPPRPWDLLKAHVAEHYPSVSLGSNGERKVTNIRSDDMAQEDFDAMVADLQEKFPEAF